MLPGMGGMNPKQMQAIMRQMGIKSEDVKATKVTIEKIDGTSIVIESPSVTAIDMKGQKSFQISGQVSEEEVGFGTEEGGASTVEEQANEDAAMVAEQAGASKEDAEKALKESNGDIAEAILKLKKE